MLRRTFAALALMSMLAACAPLAEPTPAGTAAPTSTSTATPTAVASATLTPSATPENVPDLSGVTIPLGLLCDRSGEFGQANQGRSQAVQDMLAAINAGGGIFGAELSLDSQDTRGAAEGAASALERLQQGHPALVLVCDPLTEGALLDALAEANLPALAPGVFDSQALFPLEASPQQQLEFAIQHFQSAWSDLAPAGGDALRLAVFAWPVDLAGPLELDSLGEELVIHSELPAANANVFDLIYQARDANANLIFTTARGQSLAALLNALHALGLRDRFAVVAPAMGYDLPFLEYLGDPSYANGLYLLSSWDWWSQATPGIQAALDLRSAGSVPDWGYLQMAGASDIARRALEDAVLNEGIGRLGSNSVRRALQALRQVPALNGLAVIDYSSNADQAEHLRLWQVIAAPLELEVVDP